MVDTLYLVKAIMQTTSQGQVVPIARRIDALLHGQNVTLPGGFLSCARRHTVSYPEVVQGVPYLHLGGQFNIVAHSS
jgi:hypothetical protein